MRTSLTFLPWNSIKLMLRRNSTGDNAAAYCVYNMVIETPVSFMRSQEEERLSTPSQSLNLKQARQFMVRNGLQKQSPNSTKLRFLLPAQKTPKW
ncbi:hypothetical protein F2Q70_00013780 [Brassica cretica]|uniref:Uncharacterized protein n=1 Tax=Brassica cretica TaxID=69181 RepID=A0A8S9M6Q1_BRACR|nr:hypothetical protein F2Q70_00013780 [Brassica cretica]